MSEGSPKCPSCGFINPRVWRACARCGRSLVEGPVLSGFAAMLSPADRTAVTGEPNFGEPARPAPSDDDTVEVAGPEPEQPLIGQAEAAEVIRTGIERAFTIGASTVVALHGGHQSGKTRLLTYASEFAARATPALRIFYAACRRGGGDGPYAPFSRLLLDRFEVTPSSSPSTVRGQMATTVSDALRTKDAIVVAETTHLLGHIAGVPFPDSPFLKPLEEKPEELGRRASRAVRRLIEGDASTQPVLILLDDMHHAEEDGWEIVEELVKAEGHVSVVMAGEEPIAARAEALAAAGGVAVGPIAPLDAADVAAMLHVLIPRLIAAPEALVEAIAHRSGGNPGAIRELAIELVESGLFRETDAGLEVDMASLESGGLPVTLGDAIEARLGRLDEFERAVLARAAVIGDVFWDGAILAEMRSEREPPGDDMEPTSIWAHDDDLEALNQALLRLMDKRFIERTEGSDLPGATELVFVLRGVRELLYERMDPDLRVARHTAVARWLAVTAEVRREGVAALIAPHLERAGMHVRAGRAYLEASGYELSKLRTKTALRYIERALPLIPSDDVVRKIDALHQHGSLLSTLGDYDAAIAAFTEMLRLAWTIGARGKGGAALNRIARVHRRRGEEERAERLLERALVMFRDASDLRGVAATLDDLAQVLHLRGRSDAAIEAAAESLELRRAHSDQRGEAVSMTTIGILEMARGNLDVAETCFSDALSIRKSIGDLAGVMQTHNALGVLAFERGDVDTAISSWQAALSRSREIADRRSECFVLNNLGEALVQAGRLDEAMEALEEARDVAAVLGDKRAVAEVERNLGRLALRQGTDDAGDTLRRALELAQEYGGREAIALAHRAMGEWQGRTLFDASGNIDRSAEESFLTSIDIFREIGNEKEAARSLAELGFHLIERGDVETARERLHEARAIMRRVGLGGLDKVERTLAEVETI